MSLFAGLFAVKPCDGSNLFTTDSKFKAKPDALPAAEHAVAHAGEAKIKDDIHSNMNSAGKRNKKSSEKSTGGKSNAAEKSKKKAKKTTADDSLEPTPLKQAIVHEVHKEEVTAERMHEHKPIRKGVTRKAKEKDVQTAKQPLAQADADGDRPHKKKRVAAASQEVGGIGKAAAVEQDVPTVGNGADSDEPREDGDKSETQKKKMSAEEQAEKLSRTIFVGNLPQDTSKKQLRKLFSKYGKIDSVRLRSLTLVQQEGKVPRKVAVMKGLVDKQKGSANAYVVFDTSEEAEAALKANMTVFQDHHIRVDRASLPAIKGGAHQSDFDPARTVFVGNLHFETEDEEVIRFFTSKEAISTAPELRNAVEAVRVVRDAKTQVGKGFALVMFKHKTAARAALDLHEQKLRNRPLRISRAKASQVSGGGKTDASRVKSSHKGSASPGDKTGLPSTPTGSKRAVWQGVKVKPGSKKLGSKSRRSTTGPTGIIRGGVSKRHAGAGGGKRPGGRTPGRGGVKSTGEQGSGRKVKRPAVAARKAAQLKASPGAKRAKS